MDAVAYDYDRQMWVRGAEAVALLAAQRAEEAALMEDPAYRKFIGAEPTCAACGGGGLDEDMGDCVDGMEGIHAGCR